MGQTNQIDKAAQKRKILYILAAAISAACFVFALLRPDIIFFIPPKNSGDLIPITSLGFAVEVAFILGGAAVAVAVTDGKAPKGSQRGAAVALAYLLLIIAGVVIAAHLSANVSEHYHEICPSGNSLTSSGPFDFKAEYCKEQAPNPDQKVR